VGSDPDKGVNCRQKLAASVFKPGSESYNLLQSLPSHDDKLWTDTLHKLPEITFSTIYDFLVDRKVLLRKASCIENAVDITEDTLSNADVEGSEVDGKQQNHVDESTNPCVSTSGKTIPDSTDNPTFVSESAETGSASKEEESRYESVEYTRSLDKAYRFFKDGHVQCIKYHPWNSQQDVACVKTSVLPSMRKDCIYHVTLIIRESKARVITAYCTCPAGLSGCCNHITASLYCLEDYVRLGLREEELKGCTEKLQRWNHPQKRNVEPRPTGEVSMCREEYGKIKHRRSQHINKWDCRPDTRRIVDPNKARKLRESLAMIKKKRMSRAELNVFTASSDIERKKAHEKKCMLTSYGTSCFLPILDEEASPNVSRVEKLRQERIARAQKKQQVFLQQMKYKQTCVAHDHDYCSSTPPQTQLKSRNQYKFVELLDDLYTHHVKIDSSSIQELEASTRGQSRSDIWLRERKLRITASNIKEICHHRPTISCDAFIKNKLSCNPIDVAAINYGRDNEHTAIAT